MYKVCLPKMAAESFKKLDIDFNKLVDMSSEERRAYFAKIMGETNAKNVNTFFESRLLLKNQQRALQRWADTVAGKNPEILKDLTDKINGMREILTQATEKAFLSDLVEKRLGMQVTAKEAKIIAELAKRVETAKTASDRLVLGRARVKLNKYVANLKLESTRLKLTDFKKDPLLSTGRAISDIGGQAKSINASLDASAIFNQGWKVLFTNPKIWAKAASKTISDLSRVTFKNANIIDEVDADIISRPTYDLMRKAKLAVGVTEEAFPSSLPERIPGIGRVYRASQDAYTAFVHRTRADVFDHVIKIAEDTGVDLSKAELESIGKMVNSLTGRGNLGKLEPVANVANNLLFSPRFLKSSFDVFTQPITGAGGSKFVRKQAAKNLAKIVAGTASILAIADMLMPGSVEWDPRSSDFGSIKSGNTRFKIAAGMPGVITLAARIATQSSKNTRTGKIIDFNKSTSDKSSVFNTVENFFLYKAAPVAALVRDWAQGQHFNGEKFTITQGAENLITPFPYKTYTELANDPDSANILLAMIASTLGININNYK